MFANIFINVQTVLWEGQELKVYVQTFSWSKYVVF